MEKLKIEILLKTEGGTTAIREQDDRVYVVDGYTPSAEVEVSGSKPLKEVPARWGLENVLKALLEIVEVKRGLRYALQVLESGEPLDTIRDRHVRRLLRIYDKMQRSKFSADALIEFADTVRDINLRFKGNRRRRR